MVTGRINNRIQNIYKHSCEDPDGQLVRRAQAGDLGAFEVLVLQHKESVSRTIFRITNNREDAEDQVQETFLCAFRGLREFRGSSKFNSWLTRIAVNRALTCLRKRRPHDISLDQRFHEETSDLNVHIREWRPNPEQSYAHTEALEMLTALPFRLRSALILTQFHGYSVEDAATELGISRSAAKSRVLRARRHLRRELGEKLRKKHGK
jgi:RNA polymerase sigma-70 factor, ECF subfamily